MTQAMRFNVATVLGLAAMFAGAWIVLGLGIALALCGFAIWITALFCVHVVAARGKAA